jgi:Glycosyltransferase family 87
LCSRGATGVPPRRANSILGMQGRSGRSGSAAGLGLVALVIFAFCVNASVRLPCYDVCGSDIGRLYEDRGIDRQHAPFFDRDLEYPPVIGLVMYGAGYPFDAGLRGRFLVNAFVLTALAAATTWMLWRRYGRATRRWALAPPLFVSGLTNWDLLAVAPATVALLQWQADRALLTGLLLGAGASAKLFPLLYMPMLAASCVPTHKRKRLGELIAGSVIGVAVFSLPVYIAAPRALRWFLRFHSIRGPSRGSIWYYVFRGPSMDLWLPRNIMVDTVNVVTAMLAVAAVVVLAALVARSKIAPIAACALATMAFVATNKIYSPQYDLWLVPFVVMLPVRSKLVVHFYVSSFLAFLLVASEGHVVGRPLSLYFVACAVAYRFVMLLLVARDIWVLGDLRRVGPAPAITTSNGAAIRLSR